MERKGGTEGRNGNIAGMAAPLSSSQSNASTHAARPLLPSRSACWTNLAVERFADTKLLRQFFRRTRPRSSGPKWLMAEVSSACYPTIR